MSHGIPRPTQPVVRSEEAYQKEQRRIEEYKSLDAQIRDLVDAKSYEQSTLDLTSTLLKSNPEYATRWNDRRRSLLHIFESSDPTALKIVIQAELDFLMPLLIKFPKCYAIWNHRVWLLQQSSRHLDAPTARAVWQDELGLVSKMHQRDPRNFHGWNYRRSVVHELEKFAASVDHTIGALCESEFANTTAMIKRNLSNFSAWHNRSVLIPQVLSHRNASDSARRAMFSSELAFVKNALFLDPYDQSLWFYHNHLMAILNAPNDQAWVNFANQDRESILRQEIEEIRELLEDDICADCKWIYQYLLQHASEYLSLDAGNNLFTTQEMRNWLNKLVELDPMRSGRWEDWRQKLNI